MSGKIRVRMYNVGFGDCFLLSLPGKKTILVDCGFHSLGKGEFSGAEIVEQIIQDVREISGKARIDVVIATHRHQDHVYAFNAKEWDGVEVGEVWMPWVDDPDNPAAARLWKKQQQFSQQLFAALPSFGLSVEDDASARFMLWNAGVAAAAGAAAPVGIMAAWSNAGALTCLREGFKRRDRVSPRFLPEKTTFPETFDSEVLPGVRIHVLGPPRDAGLIEELDPQADDESYRAFALRAALVAGAGGTAGELLGAHAPFGPAWQVGTEGASSLPLDASEIDRLGELARGADPLFAAEKLDGMINSTSLVLVLDIGDARLLLPGDAEWGTWKRILNDDTARALLRGASFLKVGHHGSHNATSKSLVETVLPRDIPAMISTQEGTGSFRNRIPLQELLTALEGHEIHYVRSDRDDGDALPAGFRSEAGHKWVDLNLSC
jgi:beta-lactamase superfamily II metal-dependent hydrolase